MSKFVLAAVAAVALSVGLGGTAGATEYKRAYCAETKTYCQYKKVVCYKTVTDYRTVTDYKVETRYRTETRYKTVTDYRVEKEAYVKCVAEYDHCGKPYTVKKTCYRDVRVPYERQVACEVRVPYEVRVPCTRQVPYERQVELVKWVKVCD
jgi:hypothetical protein